MPRRLVVPALLCVIAAAIAAWIWRNGVDPDNRQLSVMSSMLLALGWSLCMAIWWTFFSGLPGRVRLSGWLAALLCAVGVGALWEYDGLDGDFVPRLRPRFAQVEVQAPDDALVLLPHGDFPRFLGPNGDARVPEVHLEPDLEAHPPRLLWRIEVGKGWSSFVVQGAVAVTQEQHGDEERVVCYDLASATVRWQSADQTAYVSGVAGDGPRATPTIADGVVYTVGSTCVLRATRLEDGEPLWRRDLHEEGAPIPDWGFSPSPLVLGQDLFLPVGGPGRMLVCFDARTGEERWATGDDAVAYASCQPATLCGAAQLLLFHASAISSHDPADGRQLWSVDWSSKQPNVAQPLILDGERLIVSSGYGEGAVCLRVQRSDEGWEVERQWRSRAMKAKFANMLLCPVEGGRSAVFGLDDGTLACIDPQNGKRLWKDGDAGHGQILQVGSHLLVLTEHSEVRLVEIDAQERRVVASFQALGEDTWNPPCLAAPYLLVRNEREAALWELPLAKDPPGR